MGSWDFKQLMVRLFVVLFTFSLLNACGGGGSEESSTIVPPPHATPTLALTQTSAPEIAAQSIAVLVSLRSLGFALARELERVTPANPTLHTLCGGGGYYEYTYVDTDNSNTRSAGDQIIIDAPGCTIVPFGNGGATITVHAVDADGLTDVSIVSNGGTLPYLAGWSWVPTLVGTLRMTADAADIWIRSEGEIVFTPDALKSFRAKNLGLRIDYDVTVIPVKEGILGSLDISFDTPTGAGGTVAVDTSGLISSFNDGPEPGSVLLSGSGNSRVRIADAGPVNPGWHLIATDANGDGVEEAQVTISFLNFFDAL